MKEFDYYIFIDYSENLIGYNIIETSRFAFAQSPYFSSRVSKSNLDGAQEPEHAPEFIPRVLDKNKLKELLPKIIKFAHYKRLRHKSQYIHSIKKIIQTRNILSDILKIKIREMRQNMEIYSDVLYFIKKNSNCIIFVSIDNHEFPNFKKLVNITDGDKTKVVEESQLKQGSIEYKMSLVLGTLLNIERLERQSGKQ